MERPLSGYIDHTALKPETTAADVQKLCTEAAQEQFAAVCIPKQFVPAAKQWLSGTNVRVATVTSFPSGRGTVAEKVAEIREALALGADEVDMVANIEALQSGDTAAISSEIAACTAAMQQAGKTLKVIIESGLLTDEQLIAACNIYSQYPIQFLKTSTGFAAVGATVHAVTIMRNHLPKDMGIKAAGGIRDYAFAHALIAAGATRIGCSASMHLMQQSRDSKYII